jgi:hypothetical protein
VAALAGNIYLKNQGQLNDTRRAAFLDSFKWNAAAAAANFQTSLAYAQAVNREPSTVYANFISDATGVRLGQEGNEAARSAAKDKAKADEKAGWLSAGTSVLGAAVGAL